MKTEPGTTQPSQTGVTTAPSAGGSGGVTTPARELNKKTRLLKSCSFKNSAKKSNKSSNVFFIPAFTGLGAPYWDPEARGAIFGLSRETTKNDISQALLEAIAFQTKDVFECMSSDGVDLKSLKIDGGMVDNKYFNQILADVLNLKILLPDNKEATAKGAAFLASLGSKHTNSLSDLDEFVGSYEQFTPLESRDSKYQSWKNLVTKILA